MVAVGHEREADAFFTMVTARLLITRSSCRPRQRGRRESITENLKVFSTSLYLV